MKIESERLLNIREAAKALRLSTKTIRRMIKAGRLRGSFRAGAARGDWRIPIEAIAKYREQSAA